MYKKGEPKSFGFVFLVFCFGVFLVGVFLGFFCCSIFCGFGAFFLLLVGFLGRVDVF